jgi:hypothetical protein
VYWSRTGSPLELLAWVLLSLTWAAGGWLLGVHLFHLKSRERLFSGVAIGLLLFIVFSDLIAFFLPLTASYWAAAALVFILGLIAVWRSPLQPRFPIKESVIWPQILAFSGIGLLYTLINRGLAILDDYSNIPLVSMIAAGDVPPHFYLNPDLLLDYHYGLHLFAASLVRVGGLFPWSALDLSKSLTIALTPILAWLWFRRYLNNRMALLAGGLLVLFAGGSRWLLLFVPAESLARMSEGLQMLGSAAQTAPDLATALVSPWKIEGGGPIPFPFAFLNGIYSPLSIMAGSGAMPRLTLILLLLLSRRRWNAFNGLVYSLLLVSLALTAELYFILIWIGILLALVARLLFYRPSTQTLQWAWVLIPSAALSLVMGGVITTTASRELGQLLGAPVDSAIYISELSLRWPPALISAHLGALSLVNPPQILIAAAEIGPLVLLAPWMVWISRQYIRARKIFVAALSIMAVLAFVLPLFIRFVEREREFSRLTEAALMVWLALGFPYGWLAFRKGGRGLRALFVAGFAVTILGGIALLPTQIVAIAYPRPSYYIQEPDALISKTFWNRLKPGAWILDPSYPYRPPALFGRSGGRAYRSIYFTLPEFEALLADRNPLSAARAGYSYIYLDKEYWQSLAPDERQAYQQPCVELLEEQRTPLNDFRRLYDVSRCQKSP